MKINQLIKAAHDNASDKGFHEMEREIKFKLVNG